MGNLLLFLFAAMVVNYFAIQALLPTWIKEKKEFFLLPSIQNLLIVISVLAWPLFAYAAYKAWAPKDNKTENKIAAVETLAFRPRRISDTGIVLVSLHVSACSRKSIHDTILYSLSHRLKWNSPVIVSDNYYIYRDSEDDSNNRLKLVGAYINGSETSETVDALFMTRLCTAVHNRSSVVLKFQPVVNHEVPITQNYQNPYSL